jgi:hypothetical protein
MFEGNMFEGKMFGAFEVELEIKNPTIPYYPRLTPSEKSH